MVKTRVSLLCLVCLTLAGTAFASKKAVPMPGIFANARYVYVTAYEGDEFSNQLLPEDRAAIARVQDRIQKWGKLVVVYRREQADMVIAVESRPSEDVLAVYDGH